MDVLVVYKEPEEIKDLDMSSDKVNWITYDEGNYHEKRKAIMTKAHYAARKTPFVVVKEDDKEVVVWYSEVDDVVKCLNKYLNEYTNN